MRMASKEKTMRMQKSENKMCLAKAEVLLLQADGDIPKAMSAAISECVIGLNATRAYLDNFGIDESEETPLERFSKTTRECALTLAHLEATSE
jgi:hypothetical protein